MSDVSDALDALQRAHEAIMDARRCLDAEQANADPGLGGTPWHERLADAMKRKGKQAHIDALQAIVEARDERIQVLTDANETLRAEHDNQAGAAAMYKRERDAALADLAAATKLITAHQNENRHLTHEKRCLSEMDRIRGEQRDAALADNQRLREGLRDMRDALSRNGPWHTADSAVAVISDTMGRIDALLAGGGE